MNSATGRNASIGQKRPNISTKKKIITQKRPGHASSAQPIYRQPSANGQRGFILRSRRIDIRGGGQDPSRWKHDFQDPVQDRTTKGASSSNEGLVNQMGRLGLHGNLASEIYKAHARLDQASKDVDSRMKDAAEHDARARVLRERAKKQQPPLATSTEPSSSEPTPIGRKSTKEILEFEAVWGDYRKRLWAREIPPGKPAPFTISSSTLDGLVRVFKQREDAERRRRQEEGARARELVARKEEEAAREREAKARAHIEKLKRKRMEEERQKKETERRKVEERRRREQEEEIRKAAEEENARRAAAAAHRRNKSALKPMPSTDDPALYAWELYERRWGAIKGESDEEVPDHLEFEHLPWPQQEPITSLDDFSKSKLREFLLSHRRPGFEKKSDKERLRFELLRYHPDKFNARVLFRVEHAQRIIVAAAATRVTELLTELLQSCH